eukprot:7940268-Pyramimonas_sp.AAC.1
MRRSDCLSEEFAIADGAQQAIAAGQVAIAAPARPLGLPAVQAEAPPAPAASPTPAQATAAAAAALPAPTSEPMSAPKARRWNCVGIHVVCVGIALESRWNRVETDVGSNSTPTHPRLFQRNPQGYHGNSSALRPGRGRRQIRLERAMQQARSLSRQLARVQIRRPPSSRRQPWLE